MSEVEKTNELVQEYQLDAPPERVWRAISIAEYREMWLPANLLTQDEPVASQPGQEIRYRLRDDEPPYLESEVRFVITPDDAGGTVLTIVHRLSDARLQPANDDFNTLMLAA
ncbi:polyketide cyclase [Pantoea rodasii]|uniref:Polyketide cyclase n=1 Tax=Pantoea rodasii TaxID=1076549 RepID=A0A0B1R8V2_9GAMM|nr:polyketide cyclase [Pantoea rodasii]KHJ67535.1 polyketide cyclase [Pantoea rodasii]